MFDSLKNKLKKVLGTFSEKIKREPEPAKAEPEKEERPEAEKIEAEKEERLEAGKLKAGAPEAKKPEAAWQPAPLPKRERLPKPAIQYGEKVIEAQIPEKKIIEPVETEAREKSEAGEKPEKAEKKEEKKKWGFAQILKEKLTTTRISGEK